MPFTNNSRVMDMYSGHVRVNVYYVPLILTCWMPINRPVWPSVRQIQNNIDCHVRSCKYWNKMNIWTKGKSLVHIFVFALFFSILFSVVIYSLWSNIERESDTENQRYLFYVLLRQYRYLTRRYSWMLCRKLGWIPDFVHCTKVLWEICFFLFAACVRKYKPNKDTVKDVKTNMSVCSIFHLDGPLPV